MKLYLSSYRFGERPEKLAELAGERKRIAVIMNARDSQAADHQQMRASEEMQKLTELGFSPEEIDLREYFSNPAGAAEKLSAYEAVWVAGGNVFLLRTAVKLSGLEQVLVSRIHDESLLYAGYSAGSCLLSPTLEPLAVVDDPAVVQAVYGVPAETSGLGILEYVFVPHYMSDHPESDAAEKAVDAMEKAQISHMALTDGEVLIINGDGTTEEIIS